MGTRLDLVFMTKAEMKALLDYSTTLPTGTTVGKQWRRRDRESTSGWTMGEYLDHPDPNKVRIRWREIALTTT